MAEKNLPTVVDIRRIEHCITVKQERKDVRVYIYRLLETINILKEIHEVRDRCRLSQTQIIRYELKTDINDEIVFDAFIKTVSQIGHYHKLVARAFEIMEKFNFKAISSVDSTFKVNYKFAENQYDLLERNVNLLTHTINVVNEVFELDREELEDYQRDYLIILALFHDFGKSELVKKNVATYLENTSTSINNFKHNNYSAYFLYKEFLDIYPKEESVANGLKNVLLFHHAETRVGQYDSFLMEKLEKVDKRARAKELENINRMILDDS